MKIIMHPVWRLSLLFSSILLALGLTRVNAETVIRFQCGETENVTSPKYPDNYEDDNTTTWHIEVDLGERIIVTFNDFLTGDSDYLYMEEENYPSPITKYSGGKPSTPYVSLGNHLKMIFRSDSYDSNKGFHLSISCLKETDITGVHAAFERLEYIRILKQPICRDDWHTYVADTVCREAGFTGSYETNFTTYTSGFENDSELNSTFYQCSKSSFRLQDCTRSISSCNGAPESVVIKCNLLGELGCFNLAKYTHLQTGSMNLSRDQCVAHCKAYFTIPQYAVHHKGNGCSCINQTALDLTRLSQQSDQCLAKTESWTGHWATLLNASFGFCNEPPQVNSGSWKATSNGYLFGTSITAVCNDGYELVDGEEGLKCGRGTNSLSLDFEWHGSFPSCRERNIGSSNGTTLTGSVFQSTLASPKKPLNDTCSSGSCANQGAVSDVVIALVVVAVVVVPILIFLGIHLVRFRLSKKEKDVDAKTPLLSCLDKHGNGSQRQNCSLARILRGFFCRSNAARNVKQKEGPLELKPPQVSAPFVIVQQT